MLSVIILSVIMLSVIMLSVIMLSGIMLSVVMLTVAMLSVVAPFLVVVINRSSIVSKIGGDKCQGRTITSF
jgi:hypothetical protein